MISIADHLLNKIPGAVQLEPHYYADYIELLCLIKLDPVIAKADVLEILKPEYEKEDEEELSSVEDMKWEERIDDWYNLFEYRVSAFSDFYPFTVNDERKLKLKENLSEKHKLYIALLLASNLKYLDQSHRPALTNGFEVKAKIALENFLPEHAHVHLFGKNPLNDDRYTGKLIEKIKKLAIDINEKFIDNEAEYSDQNTGDAGLDIVAWMGFEDKNPGMFLYFAQCACTSKWEEKQASSSSIAWEQIISFKSKPQNMIFIPHAFRDLNGNWPVQRKIKNSILIDRVRMLKMLGENTKFFLKLDSFQVVEEILGMKKGLL